MAFNNVKSILRAWTFHNSYWLQRVLLEAETLQDQGHCEAPVITENACHNSEWLRPTKREEMESKDMEMWATKQTDNKQQMKLENNK